MKKAVLIDWLAGLFEPAMVQTGVEPTCNYDYVASTGCW